MKFDFRVDQIHFNFLRLQKGSLDGYAHNRAEWHRRYELDMRSTYEAVAPWLPRRCAHILDVGSGLGGIDALFARHYAERDQAPALALLDGENDEPAMVLHRRTFNDMTVAKDFLFKNGVDAGKFGSYRTDVPYFEHRFDLVTSFGSWCFHYPPETYLPRLCAGGLHHESVIILDVRRHNLQWMGDLKRVFDLVTIVDDRPKWLRCVFKPRAAT